MEFFPNSVKRVNINGARRLRIVSAKGAESISITDSPNLETIEYGDNLKDIYIPNTGISEFILPKGCVLRYTEAFRNCKNLRRIDISNSIELPPRTFAGCSSLIEVTLPNHIKELSNSVFEGCWNLKFIKGGKSLEMIETDSFKDCLSLESLDNWTAFLKIENNNELSSKYFSHSFNNHVGIVLHAFCNMWIIWDFCSHKYYFMKESIYPDEDNEKYAGFDGGGEIIDNSVQSNDIIVFNVSEKPIIKKNDKNISLFWDSQCSSVELVTKLFHPTERLEMRIEDQQILLKHFRGFDFEQFCERTKDSIDRLNIDSVIESYKLSKYIYWQIRPGRDDLEWHISETKCCQTDPFLETLLPIENAKGYSSGCRPWGFDEEEENKKLQRTADKETNRRKANARKTYSKFKHYNYLIEKYFEEKNKFEADFFSNFNLERIKQYISPINQLLNSRENSYEEAYLLLHGFHKSDLLYKRDILEGNKY